METKELKITIPEGFEIDRENSSFEKIVFKKKNTKPRSWEEYCEQQSINDKKGYQIVGGDCSLVELNWYACSTINNWRNVLPSKELANAFLAMMQLMSLRQAWIEDWEPDWKRPDRKWCIVSTEYKMAVVDFSTFHSLSFPTYEMAKEFLTCFKDLLEIAKPLI